MFPMKTPVSKLVGYSVIGRHGFLGTVVGNDSASGQPAEETIVFRGGISDSLLFHLPTTRLRSISPSRRTVTVGVDVGDFVPRPGEGGTVELYIVR
jgi:hypothetical protein